MSRSRTSVGVIGLLLAAFVASARAGEVPPPKLSDDETKLLELTNLERKKKELPALTPSPLLCQLARAHSVNMAKQGKMEHNLDGKTPFDRLRAAGYAFARGGENIAASDPAVTLLALMKAWMESKGHRENILHADYTEIGLGLARASDGQIFYTQVFARPRPKE